VFASKLMWRQLPELRALAGELPEYAGLQIPELLEQLFAGPTYVWVSRRDKVRQAVSMWRALQSRSWRHSNQNSEDQQLVYRFDGIDHLVGAFEAEDRAWGDFFAERGIDAVTISYEDGLERDPDRAVRTVLERLGLQAPAQWHAEEPMKRQADALSEDWVATYHRERELRRVESGAAAIPGR
jgi:LPS sulfotransferase NodH